MKAATRRWPPVLMGTLIVIWLLLNQRITPGQAVIGAGLAFALGPAIALFRPLQPRLHAVPLAAGLAIVVLADILRSNFDVALVILGLVRREVRSGFVEIPLDLRDPHGLAALAVIVTSTPGTTWADLSSDATRLTLHVLDLRDEAEQVAWIKRRYERPLMRIFE
ncbi:MAG TPA: Na+/H+ antiporter subunit E [Gammaproteobacteria bacterium]|nr:Na+/H+ antiporter subunit E [Gammaproteobacteria bacterium]